MSKPVAAAKGQPVWLVTFADLMALLLTFFVLLLSMSTTDVARYKEAATSLMEAFGGKHIITSASAGQNLVGSDTSSFQVIRTVKTDTFQDKINDYLAEEIRQGELELEWSEGAFTIRFPESAAFGVGSARLHQRFRPVITKIAEVISATPGTVIVSGHTDDRPIHNELYRSNWDLSAARAVSVIHAIREKRPDLAPTRFIAQGFAETRPLAPNTNETNRAHNRRVELMLEHK